MEDLTVWEIQKRLRQLLRNQLVLGKEHVIDTVSIAVAKSACMLSGISEEDVRAEIQNCLDSLRMDRKCEG